MKWVMMAILLVLLQVDAHQTVFNLEMQESDVQRIEDAMQLASQDAVLNVASSDTTNGTAPVFNQTQALSAFDATLAANLDLDPTTLQPVPGTMLSVAPQMVYDQFIDGSNATFPVSYSNATYGIGPLTLEQPTFVVAVKFTVPGYALDMSPVTLTVPMVQSYQYAQ